MIVFKGRRIYKERGDGQEALPESSLPELIVNYRIPLNQVRDWENDLKADKNYWTNKEEKVCIYLKDGSYSLLIISLGEFDNMMEDYLKREVIFKQN